MASKVLVFALLCVALVAFVQGAPQQAADVDTYDEDGLNEEESKPNSSASKDDQAVDEEEFDPSTLSEDFGTARDPGRQPEFLKNLSPSDTEDELSSALSSESTE